MKCNYRLYGGLVLLSLVITCMFLLLMPDTVPMHYDAAGVVDRFGSKYENLVFPAIVTAVAVLFYALSKTKHVQPADGKVFFFTGLGMLIFFNILSLFFLWTALTYQPDATVPIEPSGIVTLATGVLLAVAGNIMPKARRNSLFGLRTKWSLSSDTVWQKSQRFAGITGVAAGLLLILLAAVLNERWLLPVMLVILLLWSVACTVASLIYYRQSPGK